MSGRIASLTVWLIIAVSSILFLVACGGPGDNDALPQSVIPLPTNDDDGIVISAPDASGFVVITANAEIFPVGSSVLIQISSAGDIPFLESDSDISETVIENCLSEEIPTCPELNGDGMCQFEDAVDQGFAISVPAELLDNIRISYVDWQSCNGGHIADAPINGEGSIIHRGDIIIGSNETSSTMGSTTDGETDDAPEPETPGPIAGSPPEPPLEPLEPQPLTPDDPRDRLIGQPLSLLNPNTVSFQQVLPNGRYVGVYLPMDTRLYNVKTMVVIAHKDAVNQWIIEQIAEVELGIGPIRSRLRTVWDGNRSRPVLDVKNVSNYEMASFEIPSLQPAPLPPVTTSSGVINTTDGTVTAQER